MVGALGFALRGALNIDALSSFMEVAVGISIMVIGFNGFCEAGEWEEATDKCAMISNAETDGKVACVQAEAPSQPVLTTLANGVLNGVSGTGHVLGVMPALAMPRFAS